MKTKLINSASICLSFGAGSYCIEIHQHGNNIIIKEGEPQTGAKNLFLIKDAKEALIKEFARLSKNYLLDKALTAEYQGFFTHYFKNKKWNEVLVDNDGEFNDHSE